MQSWKVVTPSPNTSSRASASTSPASGAQYPRVPTAIPASVGLQNPDDASASTGEPPWIFATPKSITFTLTRPVALGTSTRLLGFTSRWITPTAWRAASASATWIPTATASRHPSGPRPNLSSRLAPSRNSIAMNGAPSSVSPTASTCTSRGCRTFASTRASATKRRRAPAPGARSTFTAAFARKSRSSHAYTQLIPPRPIRPVTTKRPPSTSPSMSAPRSTCGVHTGTSGVQAGT